MYMLMKNNTILFLLLLIIGIGFFARIYRVTDIPPSLDWDEAAVGYNAWTIIHSGMDEWGNTFPVVFKSFEDYKNPIHFYVTALFVTVIGLSDLSIRLPMVVLGTVNILLLYILGSMLFKNRLIGLFSAFSLAISPYAVSFSRFNHELQVVLFFFMFSTIIFVWGVNTMDKKKIIISGFLFGLTLLTYNSAKIAVMPLVAFLFLTTFRHHYALKKALTTATVLFLIFFIVIITNSDLLGLARAKQTQYTEVDIKETSFYKSHQSVTLAYLQIVGTQYLQHFSPAYLFVSGSSNPRLSWQVSGLFYWLDLPFLIWGLIELARRRTKESLFLLMWVLIAPIPSSLVKESPHPARAMFMVGSFHLVIGVGMFGAFQFLMRILSKITSRETLVTGVVTLLICGLYIKLFATDYQNYLKNYNEHAIEWQFGMKQIAEFVAKHQEYKEVYITADRSQPYIFLLNYLQVPVDEFRKTVQYNNKPERSSNLVTQFSHTFTHPKFTQIYHFGNWDVVESEPRSGVLYILTSGQLGGLKHLKEFNFIKEIDFPNKSVAFYLVSVY
jgi:4-amino-4-deoxy-L-arabinose transferase-like glycosyltransferase